MAGRTAKLHRGFFGIPEDKGRSIMVTSTARFTTLDELERLLVALERIARDEASG